MAGRGVEKFVRVDDRVVRLAVRNQIERIGLRMRDDFPLQVAQALRAQAVQDADLRAVLAHDDVLARQRGQIADARLAALTPRTATTRTRQSSNRPPLDRRSASSTRPSSCLCLVKRQVGR